MSLAPEDRDALGELLEQWFLAVENGEQPEPEVICADRPDLLPDFRRLIGRSSDLDAMLTPHHHVVETDAKTNPSLEDGGPIPDRLGEFDILSPIGSGGVGEVYLARQTSLQRLVALKVLKRSSSERGRARLRREAEVAASLEHPGIVPIYGVGEDDERAWIAMKWLTGPALDGLSEPLPPQRAAKVVADAARALHEAHAAGIIHRDIKPSNIVLDDESPCLVDFGLARDADQTVRTTIAGHVAGTLLYMSPEQLRSGGSSTILDARTDIYSLGATLYELLAGVPPFADDNPARVMEQILNREPAPLDVERDLATIVLRAMEKERERRFDSALLFAEDLERWLAGEPILSRRSGLATRTFKLARRHRVATSLIGAATLTAIVLAGSPGWTMRQNWLAEEARLDRVGEEIDAGNLRMARTLLEPFATDPDRDRVARLTMTLSACERLEVLLDGLQSQPEDLHVGDLLATAEALDGATVPPNRKLALALARPMALALAGERQQARAAAERLKPGRARTALLFALENRTEEWQLPASEAPIEHLFTALAMRLAVRPLPERRAEIEAGRSVNDTDWRLRLQLAIQRINEGRHELATAALEGLLREGRYPRIVRRLQIREAIQTERLDAAATQLATFEREFPRDQWTAVDTGTVLDAYYWLERPASDLLAWARSKWPDSWLITVLAARHHRATASAKSSKLLTASIGYARTPEQRLESKLNLLYTRAAAIAEFWTPWANEPDAVTEADLFVISELALEIASSEASSPEQAIAARVIAARAALAAGDSEGAQTALGAANPDTADAPEFALEFARQAWTRIEVLTAAPMSAWQKDTERAAGPGFGLRRLEHVQAARTRLLKALTTMPKRQRFLGRPAHVEGWALAAALAAAARRLKDDDPSLERDLDDALAQARELLAAAPDEHADFATFLDWIDGKFR
ncbi:MAG: serine/threonine protein kinase [bacterium]|nr:serine/threonine protein kinase [bacterium]